MVLAKLHYPPDDEIRLIELSERTLECLHRNIQEKLNLNPASVKVLFRDNEGSWVTLKTTNDLVLGLRLCEGSNPIHIRVKVEEKASEPSYHLIASHNIYKFGGIHVPPEQLGLLLSVLKLKEKHLIRVGLINSSEECEVNALNQNLSDGDTNECSEDEGFELIGGNENEHQKEKTSKAKNIRPEKSSQKQKDTFNEICNNLTKKHFSDPFDFVPPVPPNLRKHLFPGAIHESLSENGLELSPPVLHTVLRLLKIRPKRFVRLGLVRPISVARRDYHFWNRAICNAGRSGTKGECRSMRTRGSQVQQQVHCTGGDQLCPSHVHGPRVPPGACGTLPPSLLHPSPHHIFNCSSTQDHAPHDPSSVQLTPP